MTRTLLITNDYLPHVGGSRMYYHHLYSRLPKGSSIVLTDHAEEAKEFDSRQPYRILRVRLSPLPFRIPVLSDLLQFLILFAATLYAVVRYRIDCIHCGEPEPCGFVGLVMRKLFRVAYIMYVHDDPEVPGLRLYPRLMRQCYRSADGIVAACSAARQNVLRYGIQPSRIRVIRASVEGMLSSEPNPEKVRTTHDLRGRKVLLTVGRLVEGKGHDRVIKLMPRIRREIPSAVYLLVGTGPREAQLRKLVDELGLGDAVVFAGFVSGEELPSYYAACDVFVMLNECKNNVSHEGLGLVFAEASAFGKPVIGSNVGGTGDAILHGRTGYRLPLGNKDRLVRVITSLLRNDERRNRLGAAGRKYVEDQFSNWQERADALRDFTDEVTGTGSRGPGGKRRVLYIIDKLACAGTQRQLIELLGNIDRSRYRPYVCCLLYKGVWGEKVEELGIPVYDLGLRRIYGPKACLRLLRVIRLIRREGIDIVHNYLFAANVFGTLAARLAGSVSVINSRRQSGYWNENPNGRIWRLVNRFSDIVIANSENVKSFVESNESVDPDKVRVIHNGIAVRPAGLKSYRLHKELGIPRNSIIICIVANLTRVKGHRNLLKAFGEVAEACDKAHLVCIGDGPLRQKLERDACSYAPAGKVHFLGRRQDVADILADVDIGALASLSEGMPNAILEYMLAGKPVAATAVGGVTDVVSNDENGLLVSPEDSEALAEALIRLCESDQLREGLGRAGRRDIERRFSSSRMAAEYHKIYEELITDRERSEGRNRIAYIISKFPSYDETFVSREVRALVDLGLDIRVFSLKASRDEVTHQDARSLLDRVKYVPFISLENSWNSLRFALIHPIRTARVLLGVVVPALRQPVECAKLISILPKLCTFAREIRKGSYTHIHAHWATIPTESARVLARLTGVSYSFTGHAHDIFLKNSTLKKKLDEADFVLTCASSNKDHLVEKYPRCNHSKILVSYHGIDLERYLPKERDRSRNGRPFEIVAVGSLFECKGFEYLIRACAKLSGRGINYRCRIVGGGYLYDDLKSLIDDLGLEQEVELLGYMEQSQVVQYYKEADLLILPAVTSIHWGIPNVLLESLAVGTPIACTPLPGFEEIMNGTRCGFSIPEKDPDAIADLVSSCIDDTGKLMAYGKAGRRIIEEKFDLRKNALKIRDVLYEAIGKKAC